MTTLKKIAIALPVLILAYGGYTIYQGLAKAKSEDPLVWEADIAALENTRRDQLKDQPAVDGAILFIGSSSIRFWDTIASDMQPFDVVQRGFGGAKFGDVVHYADRLLEIAATPAAVAVFVGTNDIHPGAVKEPRVLLESYQQFIAIARAKYPRLPVYYIAITPSVMRWDVWGIAQQTNALIAEYSASDDQLFVIDTGPGLLGADGKPNSDLYRFDGLHLNKSGYAEWTKVILSQFKADLLTE